jgi:hypothetical protein
MTKHEIRVPLTGLPKHVVPHLFGQVKNRKDILSALSYFDDHAHEKEIFHFLNTDEDGKWLKIEHSKGPHAGKVSVPVTMQALRQQLATMIEMGDIRRIGERSGLYATPDYEAPEGEDEGENGEDVFGVDGDENDT